MRPMSKEDVDKIEKYIAVASDIIRELEEKYGTKQFKLDNRMGDSFMIKIDASIKEKRIKDMEQRIDDNIRNAIEKGFNRTYFPCDKDTNADIYSEMVSLYTKNGYKIVPTGLSGGVWQLTEDITW